MLPKQQKIVSNKLINRLIKPSKGRTLNKPHAQKTDRSIVNINISPNNNKYLKPKIAKQRLKPLDCNQKISRLKIISTHLNSSKNLIDHKNKIQGNYYQQFGNLAVSKVKSKIYSHLDQSIVIDKQIQKKDKEEGEQQKKYLTPNDFMEILKIDREMSDQFCYMNKKDGPYDWQIVQFEKRNIQQYMVISKRGLTKYYQNEVEFINFETFLLEQKIYNRLQKIFYFRIYVKLKNFKLWKKLTSIIIFRQRSKQFADKTLVNDMNLKQLLSDVHVLCQKIQKINAFYTQTITSMRLDEFREYGERERIKTLKAIKQIEQQILTILQQKSQVSMELFMKKMRISKQHKKMGQKKMPLLIGDQSGKDMPYTESATLRTHQIKIRNLLKLTDYLVLGSKTNLIINMVSHICQIIQQINELNAEQKKGFGAMSWIKAEINYYPEEQKLKFTPQKQIFQFQIQDVINQTLSRICEQHIQFLHIKEFDQFWQCNTDAQKNQQHLQIKNIISTNVQYIAKLNQTKQQILKSFTNMQNYSKIFQNSIKFWQYIDEIQQQQVQSKTSEFFKQVLYRCKQQLVRLQQIQNQKQVGIICLNCIHYKQILQKKCQNLIQKFHVVIPQLILQRAKKILNQIKINYQKILLTPLNIKQYIQFTRNVQDVMNFIQKISPQIIDNTDLWYSVELYQIRAPQTVKNSLVQTNGQIIGIRRRLEQINKLSNEMSQKFKKQIQKLIPTFEQRIKIHRQKLMNLDIFKNTNEIKNKIFLIKQLGQHLNIIIKDKQQLHGFQMEMGMQISQFQNVDNYQRFFTQVQLLWDQKLIWEIYMENNMDKSLTLIQFDKDKKYLQQIKKKLSSIQRQLDPNQVVQLFIAKQQAFRPLFNACQALMNPDLQEKHFEEVKQLICQQFKGKQIPSGQIPFSSLFKYMQNPLYTFRFFKMLQIENFSQEIVNISVRASKQSQLTDMIVKVENMWRTLSFVTTPYKQKDSILGNNDELITKIDDNLLTVNNILGSKYVGPIKPRVQIQAKMLRYMQDLIDTWYIHQKNWIYLQPILKSSFALKNLPKETSMFNQVDNKWKILMKQAKDQNIIRRYCDEINSHYTLKILKNNNETFEQIQKILQNFLDKKRDIFQRFYFLSNQQLLEILSTVKNMEQIQPFLKKVFQNFVKISFDQTGLPKTMGSLEGQKVNLKNCVFRGEVQQWFKNAQQSMRLTLKSIIRVANQKYLQGKIKRIDWVRTYPAQVVLVVDCIMWTSITEGYLQDKQQADIGQWYDTNVTQLNQLVQQIRKRDIDQLTRKKIVALITQDVHYRDIVQSLVDCQGITDFKWVQQLRFYSSGDTVLAKQVQSQLYYGYEYLGATTRLVITPLTDRCWMTITGALHIKLGANPAGPAGTGKTQSCKDLAKSLARYCIVFNCSDQINVQMMQKLFSGLAYTGSWTCLDQFNRIDIEVLSVIAQQVLTIRQALLLGKNNKELILGGKLININHDLGIFITMNPGYAGRTQLPDNLKTLFRPVAMMVPDYTLIAQIMLFSEGFSSAKQLSKKMTKLYKLSSQQLSQQDHYDFGMRAVKSVLVMAGSLKRAQPDKSQQVILIRAMQDSNIPKFLSNDIPLFNDIIQDLFPGITIPERDNFLIKTKLVKKCEELMIIPTNNFIQKNLQLNQTLKVRFGVMLVGPPMSSKSTILSTLLKQLPITINPKSVSLAQLYGNFDSITQNWTDGLAAKLLRNSATTHQFVMFDGPVDAIWVQNLNTVLDDSMMLCLSNGQRIKLSSQMRILFEVNDLNQASPATVSRCGMVWISQDIILPDDFIQSYFIKNKIISNQTKFQYLIKLMKQSFQKGYAYIKKHCKEKIKLNTNSLVHSYCKFVKNYIKVIPEQALQAQTWKKSIEKVCIYSYVWSLGANLGEDSKSRLDKSLSQSFSSDNLKSPICNFALSFAARPEGEWISWNSMMPQFEYPQDLSYSQIFVPTKQAYCYTSIVETFIDNLDPIYLSAPTGTGKTSMIAQVLRKSSNANLMFTFTAQTSPYVVQMQLESKLQTQRKSGNITLIPPPGKKFIYFIDDVNMPAVQQYGAQPPLEMLRLLLGKNGVWDRKLHIFKQVDGMQMIIAGTYGRTELPPRFIRFFNTIYIPDLEDDSLSLIFSELTRGFFKKFKVRKEVMDLIDSKAIVSSTLSLYAQIRRELLPTPEKSHYLFNLRDVSRVIQGITLAKAYTLVSPDILIKLWVHEFQRVFQDRLINVNDKKLIRDQIGKKVITSMKSNLSMQTLFNSPIVFCNFLKRGVDRQQMIYEQSKQMNKLVKVINEYMQEETSMNLVLFQDAVLHTCRVARCFLFEKGHIVLVGLSGSGKKSMIALGSTLAQAHLKTIQLRKNYGKNQFRQDLFTIMKKAAFQNLPISFLFSQNHMIHQSFLEDINNLLSSGEVPCMLTKQNNQQINQTIGYEQFLKRILNNLHLCITLSPIGQQFRSKIRNYPSLVNCCFINWIDKWPQQALNNVALIKLQDKCVIDCCVFAHKQIQKIAIQFLLTTNRKIYITPKHYIELLDSFNIFLMKQKNKLQSSFIKLSSGVSKLQQANKLIQQLKLKLTQLQPILQKKTIQQQNLLTKLQVDRQNAGDAKGVVEIQQKIIAQKTDKALQQKKQADRILNQALPALNAATQALNTLNRNDISEIKMNQNPHAQVKFTLQSVSVLLQQKQDWQTVRKTISDVNFISRLKNLDVYNIPTKVQDNIKKKLRTNPLFKPNQIKQINFAAKSLCQWVLAVVNFIQVNKQIVKKKTLVKKLNQQLAISNKQLKKKRQQLSQIINKVKQLQKMYNEIRQQKQKIDEQIILTGRRLKNAQDLTDGLKNQKIRWSQYIIELDSLKKSIVGNIFIATCFIIYLGPYTGQYRSNYVNAIIKKLLECKIKLSQNFQLRNVIGNQLQIAEWINFGLPRDTVSINSSLIIMNSLQNPMMIDPQLQASKWIKNMLKTQELIHLKMRSDNFLKKLQSALRMRNQILLETSQTNIQPSIDDLISKRFQFHSNRYFVKLGQNKIEIQKDIKIYIFTKNSNPLFLPQIFIKLCVINFTVTPTGLQDQLLADVVGNQLPDVQSKKKQLVNVIFKGKIILQKNEDKILSLLSNSKGNILDDFQLIQNLKQSKKVSNQVKISLEENVIKSRQIEQARSVYQPVANRGAILYIIISELSIIESMYQFSLQYFSRIFVNVLKTTNPCENVNSRVLLLLDEITKIIYFNISRTLFNKHKKIFSFIIAVRIQLIKKIQYNYFIKGNIAINKMDISPKILPGFNQQISNSLFNLNKIFQNKIYQHIVKSNQNFINVYNSQPLTCLKTQGKLLNDEDILTPFQNLIVTRIIKPQLTVQAISQYILDVLGQDFVNSNTPTMQEIYSGIAPKIPLVFILSVGADPLQSLLRLAKELQKKQEDIFIISLGQGQGVPALKALENSLKNGGWLILQNCHLGKSFMQTLEKKTEEIYQNQQINQNFRLFLTSMPCSYFPISILQNSLKLTSQPPNGIKVNLKQLINTIEWKKQKKQNKADQHNALIFNLCFFHAVVLERRKFGSLGWNILYDFNQSDLSTSLTMLNNLIQAYEEPPWDVIQYFIGEIVYGGRVTDDFDRRLLKTLLKDYISPQTLQKPRVPLGPPQNYLSYIESLSSQDSPQVFGMNQNAQTTYLYKIAKQTLQTIVLLESQQIQNENTTQTLKMIQQLITKMPVLIKNPTQQKKTLDAIDICLQQQSQRYNKLITFLNKNLKQLVQAVKGQIIMTDSLEQIFNNLNINVIPKSWQKKSYPSMKPFASWFTDFIQRVNFFRDALQTRPKMYWISAFLFPQGFLTSILQIYARKIKVPVDTLNFQFTFKQQSQKQFAGEVPSDGCLIYGLYSQAFAIDNKTLLVKESPLGVIESQVPLIHFRPVQGEPNYNYNNCAIPLYKTKKRAGVLSTTGHSTNFIICIDCKIQYQENLWIKRGAAFICALDK